MALRWLGLDQVWLLVSPQNPLKPVSGMAPLARRLESARATAAGDPRIRVSGMETALGTRFTADTIRVLRRRFPRMGFVWLMGADNLAQFHRWKSWDSIFRAVPVAIFARGPYSARMLASRAARRFARFRRPSAGSQRLAAIRPPAWVFLHTRLHPASSTAIRASQI